MRRLKFCAIIVLSIGLLYAGPMDALAQAEAFMLPVVLPQENAAEFTVYQTLTLDAAAAGMSGSLEILQDKRVTPRYRQAWGASADPGIVFGPDDPLTKAYDSHPLQNGRIRLIGPHGHIIAEDSFGEPLATIAKTYLYGNEFPTYLVTVDYGIGMGSYAGPATRFVEVRKGKLIELPIDVSDSLKNAWRIVPARSGAGKEIEVVNCHPNFDNPAWDKTEEFVTVYTSYRFVHGDWHSTSMSKIGMWEDDAPWPPRSAFP
jgi:hypothetical protein